MRGFSLVELSIVLVIIGLITGGILTGKSLLHAAKLNSIATDAARYINAHVAFMEQYNAAAGDLHNATTIWGRNEAACAAHPGTDMGATGTCNGNGNGLINSIAVGGNATGESFQFWRQLALAGLVENNLTGLSGPGSFASVVPGVNTMPSRFADASFLPFLTGHGASIIGGTGLNTYWGFETAPSRYHLAVGSHAPGWTASAFLTPKDARNLDQKIDDGRPSYGKVLASGCAAHNGNVCMVDDSGNAPTADCNAFAPVAQYNLNRTVKSCGLMFAMP